MLNKNMIDKQAKQHLTNGIRSGGDFAPPPGFRSPRSLRSHGSLHPQFAIAGLASQALIRNRKSSYT
jgi:hypothetical protein